MKRKCAKRNTRGMGKASKRMVYENDDEYKPSSPTKVAMKSKPLTRACAATVRSCLVQLRDETLKPKECTITTGATRNPRRSVLTNDEVSTDKGKQPAEESADENASHGNQDSYQSTNLSSRCPTKSQHSSLVACEQPRNPALSSSTELDEKNLSAIVARAQNEVQEVMQILEMAPMTDHGPLDDAEQQQPRNPTVPCSSGLFRNILAKGINENEVSEAPSVHMTEMAAMTDYFQMDDDDDEAESVDQPLICVGGYLVRKEIAPLLQEIIDKHKEIAKECKLEKRKHHVPFLKMICDICQKLRDKSLTEVTHTELKDMRIMVKGVQQMGFSVDWLLERLELVLYAKCFGKDCRAMKAKNIELDLLKEKIGKLKEQLSAAEAEFDKKKFEVDNVLPDFRKELEDLRLTGFHQWAKSLLYGLI